MLYICINKNKQIYNVMTTVQEAIEAHAKFAGKGFQNGRIATIVKSYHSKRKFTYGLNFCTAEDIEAGSYIGADGRTKMEVIQTI